MAHVAFDRVKETTTTTGTGAVTLAGAVTGFRSFSGAGVANGDTCFVCIVGGSEWETSLGTYSSTGPTITRTTVLESSNNNAAVNFSAGTKEVFITMPASRNVGLDNTLVATMPEASSPGIPATGRVGIFGRRVAGRMMPAFIGPSGLDSILQPHFGRNAVVKWEPAGNSTTISATRAAGLTATGSGTAANVGTSNLYTYMKRIEYLVTTAATTAVAGFRSTAAQYSIGGPSAGLGGFHFICRWGPATGVSTTTNRAFVGLVNSTTAPTDVQPSSVIFMIGMGWDAADTNIQMMHNAGGTATKIDLGASFPVPTADRTKVYELAMFAPPGTTQSVTYLVTDLVSGATATGTITTNIPTTTTLMAPKGWMSVGGTSSVIGIALMGLYIETDY